MDILDSRKNMLEVCKSKEAMLAFIAIEFETELHQELYSTLSELTLEQAIDLIASEYEVDEHSKRLNCMNCLVIPLFVA